MSELTAKNVQSLTAECLFRDGEDTSRAIIAEGVVRKYGFHPERLAANRSRVAELLKCLPREFQEDGGGGWFLNACVTRDGNQWGEHMDIESLLCLGIAAGQAKIQMPREMWQALPGGMPYFCVTGGAVSEGGPK